MSNRKERGEGGVAEGGGGGMQIGVWMQSGLQAVICQERVLS